MSKAKLDFNIEIKGYDGKPEPGNILGNQLAHIIGSCPDGDAWKFGAWAMEVYQGKVLELDKSDFELLKGWITKAHFPAILKMQALQVFEK